ncbi:hypothetical protein FMM05_13015 [Flavobacterium zepuense]|uniref:Lipoprotein n=1 Tax=Flavobacterium zepuense TaxID=2593302 RepID=A0A552UZC9_9FLAO|nr:hypothetical protein [Flavobacterium zepuense]TRW23576.1 hypothetical protein FMM05_13015 [Flavobacterium zepuense]
MKTNKLMLFAACTAVLVSCNKNEKTTDAPADPAAAKEAAAKDSIQKAEKAELELFKKDSIDASQIKGYTVKKISGKQKYSGEKTSVKYVSLAQQIEIIKKTSEKEMWAKEKLDGMIAEYKKFAVGGIVDLEIERSTIESANNKMFTVIIKDSNDNEVYREELESDVPNVPSGSDNWWNSGSAFIAKRVETPFYIYVVDKMEDAPFKYEVTAIRK